MSELYLVAHRVRNEPTFDVAIRLECSHCHGQCGGEYTECFECESKGYWWITSTYGHRAYPFWYLAISAMVYPAPIYSTMPANLRDHFDYHNKIAEPISDHTNLLKILNLDGPLQPSTPFPRRL